MFKKISKQMAYKLYSQGKSIGLAASKINPYGCIQPIFVSKEQGREFEMLCNEFSYYNCTKETGLKINFYILEDN